MEEKNVYSNLNIDAMDDMFNDDNNEHSKNMQKFFNELLFCVQGVGSVKDVKGIEIFVKNKYCEESLKDIHKFLRNENPLKPIIRRELAKWNFIEESLLPLLVSQKQDKKLSFLTILLLAELTYMPEKDAEFKDELITYLRKYRNAFLAPGVVGTLTEHLAETIQEEINDSTEKHAQMIELIVVIFKNLLQIPKAGPDDTSFSILLLKQFNEDSVFDSFVYMTQQFEKDYEKKLSFHFLEIFFHIFQDYCPCDFFNLAKKQTLKDFMKQEEKNKMKRKRELNTRNLRFGKNMVIKDKDNLQKVVPRMPTDKSSRKMDVGRKTAPKRKPKETDLPTGMLIHHKKFGEMNFAGSEEEENVKNELKKMVLDLLENSYNSLMNILLNNFYELSKEETQTHELLKYIKLSAFFMSFFRLNATEEHKEAKSKDKNALLQLRITEISSSLKLQNIDYIFGKAFEQYL